MIFGAGGLLCRLVASPTSSPAPEVEALAPAGALEAGPDLLQMAAHSVGRELRVEERALLAVGKQSLARNRRERVDCEIGTLKLIGEECEFSPIGRHTPDEGDPGIRR